MTSSFLRVLGFAACFALGALAARFLPALRSVSLPSVAAASPSVHSLPARVSALGRLQPRDGLTRVAGPALPVVVVRKLLVERGDRVALGDMLALLDGEATRSAEVARARAELANAERELRRNEALRAGDVVSESRSESVETRVAMARANVAAAEAELERTRVRAPIAGQVIEVYARDGMRVPAEGIVALGRTDQMFAVAEVYETDVVRVRVGQRARVSSPALAAPLGGTVERIGLQVGKLDAIGADPAARTDARVVEVEVRLDDSAPAATLTHLQVEIDFEAP